MQRLPPASGGSQTEGLGTHCSRSGERAPSPPAAGIKARLTPPEMMFDAVCTPAWPALNIFTDLSSDCSSRLRARTLLQGRRRVTANLELPVATSISILNTSYSHT